MTAVAFIVAGKALGGALGAVVGIAGGLIGSYIDNKYLLPHIKSSDTPEAKLPEFQSASEGGPVTHIVGRECRVVGQEIWQTAVRLQGSDYVVDMAVAFTQFKPGMNAKLITAWAQGHVLYSDIQVVSVTSDKLSLEDMPNDQFRAIVHSEAGGPDLSVFRAGLGSLSMSGWGETENNKTTANPPAGFNMFVNVAEQDTLKIHCNTNSDFVDEAAGETVTIDQDVPTKHNPAFLSEVEVHPGWLDQDRSAILTANDDPDDFPPFAGTTYVVFGGLKTNILGIRAPEVATIWDSHQQDMTLADVLNYIMAHYGFTGDATTDKYWNVATLGSYGTSTIVRGYTWKGVQPLAKVLEPLIIAYDLVVQDVNGELAFFRRTSITPVVIPIEDFGVYSAADSAQEVPIVFTDPDEIVVPASVTVDFIDPNFSYQPGSVSRKRNDRDAKVSGAADLHYELNMTITEAEVETIAERLVWDPRNTNKRARFFLPMGKYMHIIENSVIRTTWNGDRYDLLVTSVTRGANFIMEMEAAVLAETTL